MVSSTMRMLSILVLIIYTAYQLAAINWASKMSENNKDHPLPFIAHVITTRLVYILVFGKIFIATISVLEIHGVNTSKMVRAVAAYIFIGIFGLSILIGALSIFGMAYVLHARFNMFPFFNMLLSLLVITVIDTAILSVFAYQFDSKNVEKKKRT